MAVEAHHARFGDHLSALWVLPLERGRLAAGGAQGFCRVERVAFDVAIKEPPGDSVSQLASAILPLAEGHQYVLAVLGEHFLEARPGHRKKLLPDLFCLRVLHRLLLLQKDPLRGEVGPEPEELSE